MKKTAGKAKKLEILIWKADTRIYPLDAIKGVCQNWAERAKFGVKPMGSDAVAISVKFHNAPAERPADELKGLFYNELLHQTLRLKASARGQKLRDYIVTRALVSALPPSMLPAVPAEAPAGARDAGDGKLEQEIEKLLAETEKQDASADPLQIAVPWEERFLKKTDTETKNEKGTE